jgi:hypothetical protein
LDETPPLAAVEDDERALENDSAGCLVRAMVNDARPTSDDIFHGRERAGRKVGVRKLHGVEGKEVGAILRDRADDEAAAVLVQRTRAVGAHGAPNYQEPWVRARCTLRGDFTTQLYPRLGKLE